MTDKSLTIVEAPGILNKTYRAAAKASPALEVIGRVTGVVSIGTNIYNSYKEYKAGHYLQSAWDEAKATATLGFLFFGGEEAELIWNLGTLLIDEASGDEK